MLESITLQVYKQKEKRNYFEIRIGYIANYLAQNVGNMIAE